MGVECLDLVDFLLIAERVTGFQVEELARHPRLQMAEHALSAPNTGIGQVEYYPCFADKSHADQHGYDGTLWQSFSLWDGCCETLVGGDNRGVELFSKLNVERVDEPKVAAPVPGSCEQRWQLMSTDRQTLQQLQPYGHIGWG